MGRRAGDASRSEEALAVCADAACALLPEANMDRAGAALPATDASSRVLQELGIA